MLASFVGFIAETADAKEEPWAAFLQESRVVPWLSSPGDPMKRRWILACLLGVAGLACALALSGKKVIYETRSRYNHIIVEEDAKGVRYLLFSKTGGYQSARKPGEVDRLELPYSRVMMAGLACIEEPRRALVVGLGGASIPTFLHQRYPKMRIDCVEIDAEVVSVAKRFFGFQEDDFLRAHVADGRKYVEKSTERYDVIFLDAFGNDFVPRHLTTREFLRAVRKRLSPKGLVVANVWGRRSNALYDSMIRTYKAVFEQVYLISVPKRSNVIVLALPRRGKITRGELGRQAARISRTRRLPFDLAELVRKGYRDAREIDFQPPILRDGADQGRRVRQE